MSSLDTVREAWHHLFIESALSTTEPKSDRSARYGLVMQLQGELPDIPIDELLNYKISAKMNSLRKNYLNEEEIELAREKLSRKETSSVSFSLKAGEKYGGKYRNVDHCMVSAVVYKEKGLITNITIFYRSTEICRKWLPDLVFLREEVIPRLGIDSYGSITFMFGRVVTKSEWFWIILRDMSEKERNWFFERYSREKPKGVAFLKRLIQQVENPTCKLLRSQEACYKMFHEDPIYKIMKRLLRNLGGFTIK